MARITINGISFDPTAPGPATAALAKTDATNSDYVLVQTAAPPTEAQLEQLKKLGCVIHEYVSENTFLCTYKPKSLAKVRALKFVAWAGVYMKGFKIPPNLRQQATPAAMAGILPHELTTSTRRTLRKVDIVLHDDVDPNDTELKKKIAAAARINPEDLSMSRHKVRLNVQERYLNDLAAIDQVRHIEEAPNVKLFNSEARPIIECPRRAERSDLRGRGRTRGGRRYRLRPGIDHQRPSRLHRTGGEAGAVRTPGQDGRSGWPWHPRLRLGARQRELVVHGRRDPGHGAQGQADNAIAAGRRRGARRDSGRSARPVRARVQQQGARAHELLGGRDARIAVHAELEGDRRLRVQPSGLRDLLRRRQRRDRHEQRRHRRRGAGGIAGRGEELHHRGRERE